MIGKHLHRIYCLSAKNKKDIFYVGLTILPLEMRLRQHLFDNSGNNKDRVAKIEKYFSEMEIHELEYIECIRDEALARETFWMVKLISEGHKLVNKSSILRYIDSGRVFYLPKKAKKQKPKSIKKSA